MWTGEYLSYLDATKYMTSYDCYPAAPAKKMVKTLFLTKNHSGIDMRQLSHAAGFVAIFIEANYLIREWSNAFFYSGTCHVMLQHFAVYITLGRR